MWFYAFTIMMVLPGGNIFDSPRHSAVLYPTDSECILALDKEIENDDDDYEMVFTSDERCNPVYWDTTDKNRR